MSRALDQLDNSTTRRASNTSTPIRDRQSMEERRYSTDRADAETIGDTQNSSASKGYSADYPPWLGFDPRKRPDEPFTFPFPSVGGDSWEKVIDMVKRYDDHMCDAWIDEIQNILIFAGLFSAVVTAFAVETQKLLQPDPTVTSVFLLAQIADRLSTNASTILNPALVLPPPDVSSQTVRINVLLFMSLVFALGAALMGILALQWIRSYKKQELRSYQDQLSIRQGRYQGFMDWKVPQIITALPIVLQIALVLFFIGMIESLRSLNNVVATIVGVVVAIIFGFVLFTTVAPGLYVHFVHDTQSKSKPTPIPPYCSPQSWLFYRLTMYINGFSWLVRGQFWRRERFAASWDEFLLKLPFGRPERTFDHWLSPALGWVFRNLTTDHSFQATYQCFESISECTIAEQAVSYYLWDGNIPTIFQFYKTLPPASYSAVLSLYILHSRFQSHTPRDIHLYSMELGLRAMVSNTPRLDREGKRLTLPFPTRILLALEPRSGTDKFKQEEQALWLFAFLTILRLSCSCYEGPDDNLRAQFITFWNVTIDIQDTEAGRDSLIRFRDWVKSALRGRCDTDEVRMKTCIVSTIAYFPSRLKTDAKTLKFCQSELFIELLDTFVDDVDVHRAWRQTMLNWPRPPAMLDHWDRLLITLRLDRKYWALGSAREHLGHLEHQLSSNGRLSMDLPRPILEPATPPLPSRTPWHILSASSMIPSPSKAEFPLTEERLSTITSQSSRHPSDSLTAELPTMQARALTTHPPNATHKLDQDV